jgi:hypothetical protein
MYGWRAIYRPEGDMRRKLNDFMERGRWLVNFRDRGELGFRRRRTALIVSGLRRLSMEPVGDVSVRSIRGEETVLEGKRDSGGHSDAGVSIGDGAVDLDLIEHAEVVEHLEVIELSDPLL